MGLTFSRETHSIINARLSVLSEERSSINTQNFERRPMMRPNEADEIERKTENQIS